MTQSGAGPKMLQHRRTCSSHSGTAENSSSSAILLNSQVGEFFKTTVHVCKGCLLSSILFHLFGALEDHAGNTPRPPHIDLWWKKAHMQPTIRWWHWSHRQQQRSISRPHQQTHSQSNGIWAGSQHRNGQDTDQQHEQHHCKYQHEWPEVRGGDQFKAHGSNPVQGWHLLSRKPHQNCLSNGYNGETKQDQANMQPTIHHQQT